MMRLLLSTVVALILTSGATSADAQVKCSTMVAPVMPKAAIDNNVEGQVKARARIKDGAVIDVVIVSGPPIFHDAVREAMLQYKCSSTGAEVSVTQAFNFKNYATADAERSRSLVAASGKSAEPGEPDWGIAKTVADAERSPKSSVSFDKAAYSQLPTCPGVYLTPAWTNCFGEINYTSGQKYVGEWIDGKYDGRGIAYREDGSVSKQGVWVGGNLVRSEIVQFSTTPAIQIASTGVPGQSLVGGGKVTARVATLLAGPAPTLVQSDFESIKTRALEGETSAQIQLGDMYASGRGVKKSQSESIKWYRMAAEAGNLEAQLNLASIHEKGAGVKKDQLQANRWYQLAAENGNDVAQYKVGEMYSKGVGVKKNSEEAEKWFRLAAGGGNVNAQVLLGNIYSTGQGVAQDYAEAAVWYRQAASQGNLQAQYALGSLYRTGRGVAKDPSEAVRWFQMAATQGDSKSKVAIGALGADVAKQQREQEQLREQERQRQQAIKQEQEQLREQERQRELARKREQTREQEQQQRYQRQEELLRRQTELMERQMQQQQQERDRAEIEKKKCLENATERLCYMSCLGVNVNRAGCQNDCRNQERANVAACNGIFLPPVPQPQQIIIQQGGDPNPFPNMNKCIKDGGTLMCR